MDLEGQQSKDVDLFVEVFGRFESSSYQAIVDKLSGILKGNEEHIVEVVDEKVKKAIEKLVEDKHLYFCRKLGGPAYMIV